MTSTITKRMDRTALGPTALITERQARIVLGSAFQSLVSNGKIKPIRTPRGTCIPTDAVNAAAAQINHMLDTARNTLCDDPRWRIIITGTRVNRRDHDTAEWAPTPCA